MKGLAVASLMTAILPFPSLAAETRIGFIDSAKIFREYKLAQEAQQQFDRQVQNWRNEAAEKEKVVTQLRTGGARSSADPFGAQASGEGGSPAEGHPGI